MNVISKLKKMEDEMTARLKVSLIIGLIISAFVKKYLFEIPVFSNADNNPIIYDSIKFAIDVFVGFAFIMLVYYIFPLFKKEKNKK
jgi:hypothetical protein